MKILLLQLDGKIPNVALMRLAAHHRTLGNEVVLWQTHTQVGIDSALFLEQPDLIYASLIFKRSRELGEYVFRSHPGALVGGTGWDLTKTLEGVGITTKKQDYSIYPGWRQSIGFTQRGCRMSCAFCVVPQKEGKVTPEQTIADIWRGDPWPRELLLLDNDFFAQANPWRERIAEIREGNFKVSFNQGINARMLNEESAEAIASVRYYDDGMKTRRIYTAWDGLEDEHTVMRGMELLVRHGVKPDHIMVYMLIGYWKDETDVDWLHRQSKIRSFGARPYPMPYRRTRETIGFQRWVVMRHDLIVPWQKYKEHNYRPEGL